MGGCVLARRGAQLLMRDVTLHGCEAVGYAGAWTAGVSIKGSAAGGAIALADGSVRVTLTWRAFLAAGGA